MCTSLTLESKTSMALNKNIVLEIRKTAVRLFYSGY